MLLVKKNEFNWSILTVTVEKNQLFLSACLFYEIIFSPRKKRLKPGLNTKQYNQNVGQDQNHEIGKIDQGKKKA